MSWLERLFGKKSSSLQKSDRNPETIQESMGPGMTGEYEWSVREKTGVHQPPPPSEHMGLEGEYDPSGLSKRVASAFDKDPELSGLETVHIAQKGSIIVLKGSVPSEVVLNRLKEVAAKVDGTKAVNTSAIKVEVMR